LKVPEQNTVHSAATEKQKAKEERQSFTVRDNPTDCFERYQSYAIKLQNVVCYGSLYVDILWNIVCLRLFSAYLHLELDETCQ